MTGGAHDLTLREATRVWAEIALKSFGGPAGQIAVMHRVLVEERRWISAEDFTSIVGLCQFLPGPNIGNASIVLGKRWFGLAGSVVAFLGLMALPFIWVLALFAIYNDLSS
ncbi:MAG TPA: chromate transporter, partial [Polyangiaceae bacterium]|nr:chromate transporter [Polyangiaceae bacterium]